VPWAMLRRHGLAGTRRAEGCGGGPGAAAREGLSRGLREGGGGRWGGAGRRGGARAGQVGEDGLHGEGILHGTRSLFLLSMLPLPPGGARPAPQPHHSARSLTTTPLRRRITRGPRAIAMAALVFALETISALLPA